MGTNLSNGDGGVAQALVEGTQGALTSSVHAPEPASMILLGSGMAAYALFQMKKKNHL